MRTLLDGGDLRVFEQSRMVIASVLVDSINDKLYDEFADICIDSGAGEPVVIEDYAADLAALIDTFTMGSDPLAN